MKLPIWQAAATFILLGSTARLFAQTSASFEMSMDTNPVIGNGTMAVGDFNGDGKPDVIICAGDNGGDMNELVLRLGNGDGTFQPPVTITQFGAVDMTAVDLNNDGKLDLVMVGGNTIGILYGNGDGTFQTPVTYSTPSSVNSLAVADLNGDGYPDIAVGDDNGDVEVWNNSAGKSFALAKEVAVNSAPEDELRVRAGRFNGDSIYHLAVENGLGLWVVWNDGKENFTTQELATYTSPVDMNVGDVNQDGTDDIIESWGCQESNDNYPTGCASLDVFYGQGDKKFYKNTVLSDLQGVFAPTSIWAVDVNGDGVADIVGEETATVNSAPGLYVWLGRPDGSFNQTAESWIPSSMTTGSIVPGDFNRDGLMDFAQTLTGMGQTEFYINGGARGACTTSEINPTVTVCQPANGTYLPSPVTVEANAYDKNKVTAMQEYIDGNLDYNEDVTSFTEPFSLGVGSHLLVTKAWDETGLSFRSDRTINVYNGTPGPTCAAAYETASICLPSGTTTTSPVQIVANGYSAWIPDAAQLYIDGDLVVDNEGCAPDGGCYGGTSYVDTTQSLSNGTHTLVFKLWDADGNVYTAQKTVTVN
jgi:hypothetical protein